LSDTAQINQLLDHLFRRESGKLISILTRLFGPENIDLAEDVVQDALGEAISQWVYNGIPQNPAGWLYKVAKNKALNILNREKYKRNILQMRSILKKYTSLTWIIFFLNRKSKMINCG